MQAVPYDVGGTDYSYTLELTDWLDKVRFHTAISCRFVSVCVRVCAAAA